MHAVSDIQTGKFTTNINYVRWVLQNNRSDFTDCKNDKNRITKSDIKCTCFFQQTPTSHDRKIAGKIWKHKNAIRAMNKCTPAWLI